MNRKNLVGIPIHIAEGAAGDYDGDEYDLIPTKGLSSFVEMVQEEAKVAIPNPKPAKSFT